MTNVPHLSVRSIARSAGAELHKKSPSFLRPPTPFRRFRSETDKGTQRPHSYLWGLVGETIAVWGRIATPHPRVDIAEKINLEPH